MLLLHVEFYVALMTSSPLYNYISFSISYD